jgi:hypothetical protein
MKKKLPKMPKFSMKGGSNDSYSNYPILFFCFIAFVALLAFLYYIYHQTQQKNIIIVKNNSSTVSGTSSPTIFDTIGANMPPLVPPLNFTYSQVGILTPTNGDATVSKNILPLFGKVLHSGRDKWNYYTSSNSIVSVRLPVSKAGKSCTSEHGCDKLYNGDTVYVEGLNGVFTATLYEVEGNRYNPFVY